MLSRTLRQARPHIRCWDLDHGREVGRWQLRRSAQPLADAILDKLAPSRSGTVELWRRLDELVEAETTLDDSQARKRFLKRTARIERHLGMTFERFLRRRPQPVRDPSQRSCRAGVGPVPDRKRGDADSGCGEADLQGTHRRRSPYVLSTCPSSRSGPGLALALQRKPVLLHMELHRLNGEQLDVEVAFPDEVAALTLKAFASQVRVKSTDIVDLWRYLEVANAAGTDTAAFVEGGAAEAAEAASIVRGLFDRRDGAGMSAPRKRTASVRGSRRRAFHEDPSPSSAGAPRALSPGGNPACSAGAAACSMKENDAKSRRRRVRHGSSSTSLR